MGRALPLLRAGDGVAIAVDVRVEQAGSAVTEALKGMHFCGDVLCLWYIARTLCGTL
jgi:hypothetical protein